MKKQLFIIILTITNLFAVGEADAIFLLISPSASGNGLGGTGVSRYSSDSYSVFYNPAHSKLPRGLSFNSSGLNRVNWLSELADDIFLDCHVKRFSYSGSKMLKNDFLDLEMAITQLKFNLNVPNTSYNQLYTNTATTFSAGIKSKIYPFFYASIGYTNKEAKIYYEFYCCS